MNLAKSVGCLLLLLPLLNVSWAEGTKVVVSASSEDNENTAAKAFDGDTSTRWCASSDVTDEWLRFDFGQVQKLSGLEVNWEFPGQTYSFSIDGSNDGNDWKELGKNTSDAADKKTKITGAFSSVRIRVTTLPEGKWASITEVRFFDGDGKVLKNNAIPKAIAVTASSAQGGNSAAKAFDGSKDTRWCATSGDTNEWLGFDFDKPKSVAGIEVDWEFPEDEYEYTIEGSKDGQAWSDIATVKSNAAEKRTKLSGNFSSLRIKATSLPEGKWASITEVRLFDASGNLIK